MQCWPLYLTSVRTAFHMAAVLTAVPHFCMNYIPRGCSADRCTSLPFELYSIWLQCWPLYLTFVRNTFHVAAVLTAVPHFRMNYIPRGCSADRCTTLLFELHSIWLQCWPLYLTFVWTTFHVAAVLTSVPHFCKNFIPRGCIAERCTSLLYELHSIWLQCWPLCITSVKCHYTWPHCLTRYVTSVWTTSHFATVLTALLHFSLHYDRFTSLLARDQLTGSSDIHIINTLQNFCLYVLLFSLGLHFVRCNLVSYEQDQTAAADGLWQNQSNGCPITRRNSVKSLYSVYNFVIF